jgi:uncharacterized protein YlxP (DUF503 family)
MRSRSSPPAASSASSPRRSADLSAFVALELVHLHFPATSDLKGKRKQVSSLKSQLHGRLGAAVSEVDHQDRWQRATLAVAFTAPEEGLIHAACDRAERFVLERHPEGASFERWVASEEDLAGSERPEED